MKYIYSTHFALGLCSLYASRVSLERDELISFTTAYIGGIPIITNKGLTTSYMLYIPIDIYYLYYSNRVGATDPLAVLLIP